MNDGMDETQRLIIERLGDVLDHHGQVLVESTFYDDGDKFPVLLIFPSFSDAMGWVNGESVLCAPIPDWNIAFGYPEEEEQ